MIIDPHAHIAPQSFIEDARRGRFGRNISVEQGEKWELLVTRSVVLGEERVHPNALPRETWDVEMRLKHMKRMGVDRQILSVVPPMTYYALDAGLNKEISAALNDGLAELAGRHPDKFHCMAQVPLQDPQAAAEELRRAVKAGHLGVQIASNVAGKNLDDRGLDVFWQAVVDLDVPIFIHPITPMGANDRLKEYHLQNLIGLPVDTAVAAACIIFGGVFDRFPKLKFLLSHCGGITPWMRGRWQHGYAERQEPKKHGAKAPERYIKKFYYDTITHNPDAFAYAVQTLGVDRILYGTDYPFDMGNLGKAAGIPGLSKLPKKAQAQILEGNVMKLYKIKAKK